MPARRPSSRADGGCAVNSPFLPWGSVPLVRCDPWSEMTTFDVGDKVVYPQLKRAASSMFDVARIAMFHVLPTSDPAGALSAPVTELATFTARTARSKPVIEVLVDLEFLHSADPAVDVARVDASAASKISKIQTSRITFLL